MKILAGVSAAGVIAAENLNGNKAECCGIAGVIGVQNETDARYVMWRIFQIRGRSIVVRSNISFLIHAVHF